MSKKMTEKEDNLTQTHEVIKEVIVEKIEVKFLSQFEQIVNELMSRDKRRTILYLNKVCKHFTNMEYQQLETYLGQNVYDAATPIMKDVLNLFLLNLKYNIVSEFNNYNESCINFSYNKTLDIVSFGKLFNTGNRHFFNVDDKQYFVDRNANLYSIKADK